MKKYAMTIVMFFATTVMISVIDALRVYITTAGASFTLDGVQKTLVTGFAAGLAVAGAHLMQSPLFKDLMKQLQDNLNAVQAQVGTSHAEAKEQEAGSPTGEQRGNQRVAQGDEAGAGHQLADSGASSS